MRSFCFTTGDGGKLPDLSPQSGQQTPVSPWQPEFPGSWQGVDGVMESYHKHQQGKLG